MGFLSTTLPPRREPGPRDEELLWNMIQVMNRVDGVVEPSEQLLADALSRTVPQLRSGRNDARPTLSRKALLDACEQIQDAGLRRQLYVVAVEAALASGEVNESEDQYADHLRRALRVDETFARNVVDVIGAKYAR
jgi:hypothetical protein